MDALRNDTARIELHDPLVLVITRWVIGSTAIIANSFAVFVFIYNKIYKKNLSFKLLLHQTVIDLIGSLMLLILHNMDVPDGIGGTILCKARFLFLYLAAVSTYNFVMLTIERYIAIVHPVYYYQRPLGGKITYMSLIIPHVCGISLTASIPFYAHKNPNVNECIAIDMNDLASILVITMDWLVPISVMLYCYVKMLLKLHKSQKVGQQPSSVSRTVDSGLHRVKSDLLLTLILIAFAYFLTLTPCSVLLLIYFTYHSFIYPYYIFYKLGVLFMEINLTINPFIYCMTCKDFKREIRKIRNDICVPSTSNGQWL